MWDGSDQTKVAKKKTEVIKFSDLKNSTLMPSSDAYVDSIVGGGLYKF